MKTIERYQITVLTIASAGEKQLFQIKLPRNAKKITGILVTVKPTAAIPGRSVAEAAAAAKTPAPPLIPIEHAI
jgi:hypothetical protein